MDTPSTDVLVVDDDADIADLLVEVLTQEGFTCRAVLTLDAVALALARPPRCLVLDLLLPGLDGAALLAGLRADARTRDLPVLVLTAVPATVDESLLRLGANVVLHKPFPNLQDVVGAVRALIGEDDAGPTGDR